MADSELEALTKAFSGHGVDEKSLIEILGKWQPEERKTFRKKTPHFFVEDERSFERWDDQRVRLLKHEFMRFKNAVVLWAMHPWERDARLVKEGLKKGPQAHGIIVEVACTRSAEQLLGARKAYHSLFDHSIEEDVASHITSSERKLLVALVSAYRYEGTNVTDDAAKSDAKILASAIKRGDKFDPIEDDEVVRILSTRSKPHVHAVYKYYREITGKAIDEDLSGNERLLQTVQCICTPHQYFSQVLDVALKPDADKSIRKALTHVVVTRADSDMKGIKEAYQQLYGVSLHKKIEDTANGSYKDFMLTLVARGG